MTLVAIASPDNEADVALIACVLEANDIPHFVQGGGFGGLFPGPQINAYNSRRVLVPESCVERAIVLLADFNLSGMGPLPPQPVSPSEGRSKLAMLLETFFLGWFMPDSRKPPPDSEP